MIIRCFHNFDSILANTVMFTILIKHHALDISQFRVLPPTPQIANLRLTITPFDRENEQLVSFFVILWKLVRFLYIKDYVYPG